MLLVAPSPFLHKKAPAKMPVQKIFYKKRATIIL